MHFLMLLQVVIGGTNIEIVRVVHSQPVLVQHISVDGMVRYPTLSRIPLREIRSSIVNGVLRIQQVTARKAKMLSILLARTDDLWCRRHTIREAAASRRFDARIGWHSFLTD